MVVFKCQEIFLGIVKISGGCSQVPHVKNQRELYKMRSFFKSRALYTAALFIELYPQLSKDPNLERSTSGVVGFQGVRPGEREDLRKSL